MIYQKIIEVKFMKLKTQIIISIVLGVILYGINMYENPYAQNTYEKIENLLSQEYTKEDIKEIFKRNKYTLLNLEDYVKNTLADIDETMEKERRNMVQ